MKYFAELWNEKAKSYGFCEVIFEVEPEGIYNYDSSKKWSLDTFIHVDDSSFVLNYRATETMCLVRVGMYHSFNIYFVRLIWREE